MRDKQMCGGVLVITDGDRIQLGSFVFTLNVFMMESCSEFSSKSFGLSQIKSLMVVCLR